MAAEDAEYVEVGAGEVWYKRAAGGAHELLEAAEQRIQQLQSDLQQYAGEPASGRRRAAGRLLAIHSS